MKFLVTSKKSADSSTANTNTNKNMIAATLILATALPLSNAFTPTTFHHPSSFAVQRVNRQEDSILIRSDPTVSRSSKVRNQSASSSSLYMNLFDRFTRVAKANVNSILKSLEDPEKILNQAVEDMQADLVKIRQSYAEVTATQRRLLKQKEQADALAQDWYQRAQLALQKGNEELAREALTRRQQQVDQANDLQNQIDMQNGNIDKMYEGMQQLESSIMEAKSKKEQMIARARTAESTQKVNDMLSGISGKTSMDAFKRMEDKVEALEAAAEVSAEMGALRSGNLLPGGSDIEKEFKKLEAASSVDDELRKMKGLLTGSSTEGSSSTAAGKGSAAVDDELAKLKRDAGL